jgi:hypothetical protein
MYLLLPIGPSERQACRFRLLIVGVVLIEFLLLGGFQPLLQAHWCSSLVRVHFVELLDLERGVLKIGCRVPRIVMVPSVPVDLVLELLVVEA